MFTTIKKKLLKKPAIAVVQFTYVLLYCINLLFDTLNLNSYNIITYNITFTINLLECRHFVQFSAVMFFAQRFFETNLVKLVVSRFYI